LCLRRERKAADGHKEGDIVPEKRKKSLDGHKEGDIVPGKRKKSCGRSQRRRHCAREEKEKQRTVTKKA
jgi:hypothetical protein